MYGRMAGDFIILVIMEGYCGEGKMRNLKVQRFLVMCGSDRIRFSLPDAVLNLQ